MTSPGPVLPDEARLALQIALRVHSSPALSLPVVIVPGHVLRLVEAEPSRGACTQVRVGCDARGWYLDYLRRDIDVTWHGRVRIDGSHEDLDNLEGQFGVRAFADPIEQQRERERVQAHNDGVRARWRAEGFEP